MKEVKITSYQLALLMIAFIIGSSTIIDSAHAGRDAWLAYIIAWMGGFFLVFSYAWISLMNPGKTLVEILKDTFGKILGSILALGYIWYFIHLAALVTRDFSFFLVTTSYERTPEIFMIICFIFLSVYTLKKGLQVFSRSAEVFVPMLITFILILCLVIIGRYDVGVFLPFLEEGFKPVLNLILPILTFPFGETVVFLMLFSALDKKKNIRKISVSAVGIGGMILLLTILRDLMALGPDILQRIFFPPSLSSELIPVMNLDPLIGLNLLIAGGTKITVCFYGGVVGITQIFNLNSYKPFVIPVAALIIAIAMMLYNNIFEMFRWANDVYPYYAIPFQILIPFAILGISLYKKYKKINKQKAL